MSEGTIKFFDIKKGYGFIIRDTGGEIYFHKSDVIDVKTARVLKSGDRVSLDVSRGPRGPRAIGVRLID